MAFDLNQPITADELARLPGHDRSELVAGTLRVSEPPGGVHGQVAMHLGSRLHGFVDAHRLGVVLVESGFILRRAPDTVRGPDLSFVGGARIVAAGVPSAFFPEAPDLAVEIRLPDDRSADLADKVADYLRAGTRLVWVVDPAARIVTIHRADGSVVRLGDADWLDGEDVVPGFRCRLSEVLATWSSGSSPAS